MTSSVLSTVSKNDSCYHCLAPAGLHLKNPFGLYWKEDSVLTRVWKTWVDMMTDNKSQYNYCGDFVTSNGEVLDHDTLYKQVSS